MDMDYFMKIQNAYGTKSKHEKELAEVNREMSKHFEDTFDTETVLINGIPSSLMIIKDTDGNTFKKRIKSRHEEKINLGDYVFWNEQHWIITLIDTDDKTWNRGYMCLCTVPLRWQNSDGEIIVRWAYSEDYTKYSSGVKGNSTLSLGDNQYGLTIPIDSETKKLHRDLRFSIDFDDAAIPDIYRLTNRKVNLNNNEYFKRGGTMVLTLSYDSFNSGVDKYVTLEDGSQVWICDYHSPISSVRPETPEKTPILYGKITCRGKYNIVAGGATKTFTYLPTDKEGNEVHYTNFFWNIQIQDNFTSYISKEITPDNKCKIRVIYNEVIVGQNLILYVTDEKGVKITSVSIEIGGGL